MYTDLVTSDEGHSVWRVQKSATNIIPALKKYSYRPNYTDRLKKLGLTTLQTIRRVRGDMI